MEKIFEYFLKVFTLPQHFTLYGALRVFFIVAGVAVWYLITLRKSEEGKIEDYLQRVWNRVSQLRQRALSRHLAFINATAAAITSLFDRLFGLSILSLQSIGVSISLALFFTNLYFLITGIKTSDFSLDHLFDCMFTFGMALFPFAVTRYLSPACAQGIAPSYQVVQCRYLSLTTFPKPNFLQLGFAALGNDYQFACLCSTTWITVWFVGLVFYIYQQYFAPLFCLDCIPEPLRKFAIVMFVALFTVFAVAAVLFTFFSLVTRLTLKKLATTTSTTKAIAYLLLGCLPIPTFALLLKIVLVLVNRWITGQQNIREWIAVGLLFVFILAFFINVAFVLTPVIFFIMAILLLLHRLMWPMIERPLEKLHRIGITKHPWIIFLAGTFLIAFGVGGLDAVLKVWRFLKS